MRIEPDKQGTAVSKHPFLSRVAAYVTYEETFGNSVEDQTIINSIQSLPIEYWLRLASVGTIFLEHFESKADSQSVLLHHLFPKRFSDMWHTKYKNTQSVFFHRTQFLALYRLALLYATVETSRPIPESERREAVARCLLGINSLIHKTLIAERDGSFNFGKFLQKLYSNLREPLTTYEQSYLMSYLQAYSNHVSENLGYTMGRYKEMLFDIPDDASFIPAGLPRDLFSTTLQQQTGLSIVDYTALTFGVIAKYIPVESIFKKGFHFPISKKNHFSRSSINAEVVNRFWDLIGQCHSDFLKAETTTENLADSITNFRNIMLKPAVNLDGSDDLYPASLVYLQRLLALGGALFWIATGNRFMEGLRGWLGEVFEFYCRKICTEIKKTACIRPKYFGELEYGRPGARKKSCDAILVYGNSAVMMEFKIKSPKLVPTIIEGRFDSLIQDIDEAFIGSVDGDKAAKQIHDTIHDIRTGELSLTGIDSRSITTYFPVVVTFQPWPLGPFVYDLIRREIHNAGLLRQSCCAPLEIWSCEEFESIESILISKSIAPVDMPTLLRKKLYSTHRSLTMATFLWDEYQREFPANERLGAAREEMFRIILSTLSLSQ
jgi:hypothetical protein